MKLLSITLLLSVAALTTEASAQQPAIGYCPDGAPSCIVVTMTPDEVRSLTQPGGIFDQAVWANRSGMDGLVQAWKQKLATSLQGMVPKKDDKKEETPKQ
jgi:hypothetical protein